MQTLGVMRKVNPIARLLTYPASRQILGLWTHFHRRANLDEGSNVDIEPLHKSHPLTVRRKPIVGRPFTGVVRSFLKPLQINGTKLKIVRRFFTLGFLKINAVALICKLWIRTEFRKPSRLPAHSWHRINPRFKRPERRSQITSRRSFVNKSLPVWRKHRVQIVPGLLTDLGISRLIGI